MQKKRYGIKDVDVEMNSKRTGFDWKTSRKNIERVEEEDRQVIKHMTRKCEKIKQKNFNEDKGGIKRVGTFFTYFFSLSFFSICFSIFSFSFPSINIQNTQ